MLIVMNANAAQVEIDGVVRVVESLGFRAHVMPGATRTAIGVTGNQGAVDLSHFENLKQAFAVADVVQRSGAKFFRGGAFKPRTSPYAFAGLGEEGLEILAEIREKFGLKIVTEALDESNVDLVERYGDM